MRHPLTTPNDSWLFMPMLWTLQYSLLAHRAKFSPRVYSNVQSNCTGVSFPKIPEDQRKSSCSSVIMSTCFADCDNPWQVLFFISLSTVYFKAWKSGSSKNFQWRPCISNPICRHTMISYKVFGRKSVPSIFFTSIINAHKLSCTSDFSRSKHFSKSGVGSFWIAWNWEYMENAQLIFFLVSGANILNFIALATSGCTGSWKVCCHFAFFAGLGECVFFLF